MAESRPITIRFPKQLFEAIKKCADARGKDFSKVVVETCEERYTKHEPTIADRVKVLEQDVNEIKEKLDK
jgi:predicted DNA binding CopG/RHH family protein